MKPTVLYLILVCSAPFSLVAETNDIAPHERQFLEAVLLMQRGLYAEAEKRLQQLLAEYPDNVTLQELLQQIQQRRGTAPDTAANLRAMLQQLIVPQLDIRDAPVQDVLEQLRAHSRQLDPATNGVNIVWLASPEAAQKRITLTLRQIPLGEVLRYVAQAAGVQLHVEAHAVVYRPFPGPPAKPSPDAPPAP